MEISFREKMRIGFYLYYSKNSTINNIFFVLLVALLPSFSVYLISQTKSFDLNKYQNQTIMNVGSENVTFGEAKKIYDRNSMKNGLSFESISLDSAKNFLDMYAKYKMKVSYGKTQNYDKDSSVINEVKQNRRILAESFLLENELIEPAIRKYTEMRKLEKQIAIIVTHFNPNGDTTEAYNNIMTALQEIKNGESFEYVAKKYSADSLSASNGGVVPLYVTGMRLQREVEDAIYALKIGETTQRAIRTEYGYFLIKCIKSQPRQFASISHILIPFKNDNDDFGAITKDTAHSKHFADSLYQAINNGADFNELARKFSADKSNSDKGGLLGVYARSTGVVGSGENILPEIEDLAFGMQDKQVSPPVKTPYGHHIIRRDSTVVFPADFEYNELKSNYNQLFLQADKQAYYDSLAVARCNFKINETVFNNLLSSIDTTKTIFDTSFTTSIPEALKQSNLYSINNVSYTVNSFVTTALSIPDYKITATNRKGLTDLIKKMIQPIIVDVVTSDIHKTHPQFQAIMDDFSAGLILFKAEEVNIWNKILFDTLIAKQFYDTTSMDLTKPLRYDISEIYLLSESKAKEIYEEIKSGKINYDSAATAYTQRPGHREKQGRMGLVNTSNILADIAKTRNLQAGDITEPVKLELGWAIIKVNAVEPERKETFEEALPRISAPVQAELTKKLEKDWQDKLEKEYKVKINEKLLKEIYKQ